MMRKTKIMMACAFLALCGSAWAADVNDPNLIAHWKLDEGSGTTAYDSAGTNNGTLLNDPTWTTGRIGGALDFDGINDYVDVGDPPDGSLDFGAADSFTLGLWFKMTSIGTLIFKKKMVGSTHYEGYLCCILANGKPYFGMEDTDSRGVEITGTSIITAGEWHHIVVVRDTSTDKVYLYLDGVSNATPLTDPTTTSLANNVSFWIGRRLYYDAYFDGAMDDVRVYNRALSAEEAQKLYWEGLGNHECALLLIEDVVRQEAEMAQLLDEAMEKKERACAELEELLMSGDYGDLKKSDIIKAKQKVSSAIKYEEQCSNAMEKGIEDLDAALEALGWAAEPEPDSNSP